MCVEVSYHFTILFKIKNISIYYIDPKIHFKLIYQLLSSVRKQSSIYRCGYSVVVDVVVVNKNVSFYVYEDVDLKCGTLMYYGFLINIVTNNLYIKINIFSFINTFLLREKLSGGLLSVMGRLCGGGPWPGLSTVSQPQQGAPCRGGC